MSLITSKAPNPDKGRRYLASLDQALCNGSWLEVAELARKTDKHAPERKCFTLTARTEAQIASASHRPTSASSTGTSSIHSLNEAIPKLEEAIATADSGEAYCAQICLAEVYWLQEDAAATLKALAVGSDPSATSGTHTAPLGWLEVCSVKASYMRAAALEALGEDREVQAAYRAAVSQTPGSRTPELRRWTERLLARACMYGSKGTVQPNYASLSQALSSFRAWSNFWQRASPPVSGVGIDVARVEVPRRQVWKAYYDLLSNILQHGFLYNSNASPSSDSIVVPGGEASDERYVDAKIRQRAELKRVESTYESLLFNETQFPKASQTNTEIEGWIEQAVGNWRILCGAAWTDAELGEGGKDAVGRAMLEILYRAATKTFHSTAILRQLFNVHAAIGEFELAIHAFNSYVEIVGKGKARALKTGKHPLDLDTDDTAIMTAADAVRVLCKYGDRDQAEKATAVSKTLQEWLDQQQPTTSEELETREDVETGHPEPPSQPPASALSSMTLAAAHRAIGTAQAHWARLTYDTDARSGRQSDAVKSLRKALAYDAESVESAYALARVLAETQDVPAAIVVIKHSIAVADNSDGDDGIEDFGRHRQLIPMWHLLSLCLTAGDDYEPAMKMCEAALGQFGDASVLFGQPGVPNAQRQSRAFLGLVDQMDFYEKQAIIEIKMTQLTFVELTEGAESAVELCEELLSFYARLFGSPEQLQTPAKPPLTANTIVPPTRSGGRLRSIAGSIRHRSGRTSVEKGVTRQPSVTSTAPRTSAESGPPNGYASGSPIAITLTNEDGVSAEKPKHDHHHHHHLHVPFKIRGHHGDSREVGNLRTKRSAEGLNNTSGLDGRDAAPAVPPKDSDVVDHAPGAADPSMIQPAVRYSTFAETSASPQQPLGDPQHNTSHGTWLPHLGHDSQSPEHDVRSPAPLPAFSATSSPQFSSLQQRQHQISILVKLWLFIAGLYVRADLHDDASGATEEACKLVETLEADKGAQHANARRLFEKGWGGGKSVDELWADAYSLKGGLATARGLPFEAMEQYERALSHFPDHAEGIIGLSDLLMDIYEEKLPAEEPQPLFEPSPSASGTFSDHPTTLPGFDSRPTTGKSTLAEAGRTLPTAAGRQKDPMPAELNRLAARDRAYMLLVNLTKLGSGWDNAEAWFTLARAYELSKQVGKAKQALWWVVELENSKPMRAWCEVTAGGYVL
ncbi:hypothetical protein LTR08_004376 [Meristemomyces frigidus]|nr:hypothetical protein LTR08_004376 [Meristemomyces frigidus]